MRHTGLGVSGGLRGGLVLRCCFGVGFTLRGFGFTVGGCVVVVVVIFC